MWFLFGGVPLPHGVWYRLRYFIVAFPWPCIYSIFPEAQQINKKKSLSISYMNPEEGCEVRASYVTRL